MMKCTVIWDHGHSRIGNGSWERKRNVYKQIRLQKDDEVSKLAYRVHANRNRRGS